MAGKTVTPINQPNKVDNFYPADDQWILKRIPMKASVAIEQGTLISPETGNTGNASIFDGVANATGLDFYGICAETIASTDDDFSEAGKLKGVWFPLTKSALAYFTVGAGTFTQADVFKTVALHTDKKSLAVDTAGLGARIVEFKSPTRGVCNFDIPATQSA